MTKNTSTAWLLICYILLFASIVVTVEAADALYLGLSVTWAFTAVIAMIRSRRDV